MSQVGRYAAPCLGQSAWETVAKPDWFCALNATGLLWPRPPTHRYWTPCVDADGKVVIDPEVIYCTQSDLVSYDTDI